MEDHNSNLQAIGDDFYESLSDLTFNSRPIISSLTEIAQENVNAAQFITSAVEKRIEKATPNQKLFAFYLLDSISKNIGSPYTLLFGANLFQTFTQAYLLVNDETRLKFISLFKTWKIAKNLSGLPLFPQEPIDKIERFLIKASSIYQQQQQLPSIPNILTRVNKLVELTTKRSLTSHDDNIKSKLELINQLKFALESNSVPESSLPIVSKQVEDMMKQEEELLRRSATPVPNLSNLLPIPSVSNVLPSSLPTPSNSNVINTNPINTNPINTNPINTNPINASNNKNPLGLLNNIINLKKPKPKTDLNSLITTLKKTGLVKEEKSIPSNSLLKSLLIKKEESNFNFNNKNLFNLDPANEFKLIFIKNYPNKCGQCGKRFNDNEKGLNLRREHLDWHFRMNKKLKDGFIPQSKIWYLDDEDFVNFRDDEIFNKEEDEDIKEEKVEEVKKYVIVPQNSDMSCICGICKETIKAEYDDELGEWIWMNSIENKGKIFHFNCFSEANNTLINIVKRNREEEEEESKKKPNLKGLDMTLLKNLIKTTEKA